MEKNEITIGDKFYKVDENDKLSILRIVRIKNENTFMVVENSNKFKIDFDALQKGYTRLKPDGYLTFSIVSLDNNMKDIIITLHRQIDLDDGNAVPYAACRQSIFDLFANQILTNNNRYVGTSISKDTCPDDIDFNIILACNALDYANRISIYKDDSFEDILSLVQKKTRFDDILKGIYEMCSSNKNLKGYCKSLKDLLEQNYFMFDFYSAFNILRLDFKLEMDDDYRLEDLQKILIEDTIKHTMYDCYCIKYNYEISLEDIEKDYILVSDTEDDLYVLVYIEGKYINRPYNKLVPDKLELATLNKYSNKGFND